MKTQCNNFGAFAQRIMALEEQIKTIREPHIHGRCDVTDHVNYGNVSKYSAISKNLCKGRRIGFTDEGESSGLDDTKKILDCWNDCNLDLHLRIMVNSARRNQACYILEFLNRRLTSHMLRFISDTAESMSGKKEANFLSQFTDYGGPFCNKPLTQGTYKELLHSVSRHPQASREMVKALEAAEHGLEADAEVEGYTDNNSGSPSDKIGDIRLQMAVFARAEKETLNSQSYCIPGFTEKDVSKDFILDIQKSVEEGKMGRFQSSAKLIKLGCYLLMKRIAPTSVGGEPGGSNVVRGAVV